MARWKIAAPSCAHPLVEGRNVDLGELHAFALPGSCHMAVWPSGTAASGGASDSDRPWMDVPCEVMVVPMSWTMHIACVVPQNVDLEREGAVVGRSVGPAERRASEPPRSEGAVGADADVASLRCLGYALAKWPHPVTLRTHPHKTYRGWLLGNPMLVAFCKLVVRHHWLQSLSFFSRPLSFPAYV